MVKQPKLEIKKDAKGMVTVPGATVVEVTSAKQLWAVIEAGQKNRHVAATQVHFLACMALASPLERASVSSNDIEGTSVVVTLH